LTLNHLRQIRTACAAYVIEIEIVRLLARAIRSDLVEPVEQLIAYFDESG